MEDDENDYDVADSQIVRGMHARDVADGLEDADISLEFAWGHASDEDLDTIAQWRKEIDEMKARYRALGDTL